MNVHLISTGKVKITQNWREGKGSGVLRLANTLLDRHFTDWLPIYCAVIEHPGGLIVVDTGISADANTPVYFPPHIRVVQRAAPFQITPEQEIGVQMRARGLNPTDVRWVVLTHLHQDHDGGLQHFPNAEFVIARKEWQAGQGWSGRFAGYFNWRWTQLSPRLVDFSSGAYHSFASSEALTQDIRLVPTPGHSAEHLSVVVERGDHALLLAGDAAYSQDLLLRDVIDGVGPDAAAQHETHHQIIDFAKRVPTVFVPSHDPEAATRLEHKQTIDNRLVGSAQIVFFLT